MQLFSNHQLFLSLIFLVSVIQVVLPRFGQLRCPHEQVKPVATHKGVDKEPYFVIDIPLFNQ